MGLDTGITLTKYELRQKGTRKTRNKPGRDVDVRPDQ